MENQCLINNAHHIAVMQRSVLAKNSAMQLLSPSQKQPRVAKGSLYTLSTLTALAFRISFRRPPCCQLLLPGVLIMANCYRCHQLIFSSRLSDFWHTEMEFIQPLPAFIAHMQASSNGVERATTHYTHTRSEIMCRSQKVPKGTYSYTNVSRITIPLFLAIHFVLRHTAEIKNRNGEKKDFPFNGTRTPRSHITAHRFSTFVENITQTKDSLPSAMDSRAKVKVRVNQVLPGCTHMLRVCIHRTAVCNALARFGVSVYLHRKCTKERCSFWSFGNDFLAQHSWKFERINVPLCTLGEGQHYTL